MRPRLRAALILAGTFLLGGAVGGSLVTLRVARTVHGVIDGRADTFDARVRLLIYDRALGLSSEQREKAREILERHSVERFALLGRMEPELGRARTAERTEMRALLTPAQQKELDRLAAEVDAKVAASKKEIRQESP